MSLEMELKGGDMKKKVRIKKKVPFTHQKHLRYSTQRLEGSFRFITLQR